MMFRRVFVSGIIDGTTLPLKDHCSIHTPISIIAEAHTKKQIDSRDNFLACVTYNGVVTIEIAIFIVKFDFMLIVLELHVEF